MQLPEPVDNGLGTIAEICRERIRRVLASTEDPSGFRAFQLGRSGWSSWDDQDAEGDLATRVLASIDRRQGDRPNGHRIWEIALRAGLPLDMVAATIPVGEQTLWTFTDALVVCFDTPLTPDTIAAIREFKDRLKPGGLLAVIRF